MHFDLVIRGTNIDSILYQSLRLMKDMPETPSRVEDTRELLGSSIYWTNTRNRYILNPERKHNIMAQIAETVWTLAGDDRVSWLEKYLPRAGDFSDDGEVWRAAYGPRIRNWHSYQFNYGINNLPAIVDRQTDQLKIVINELLKTQGTRQAVMSIWDPHEDGHQFGKTKDIPCNNWVQFIVRDGRLHMLIVIRSNDAIWGMTGVNLFIWSTIHEIVGSILNLPLGAMKYMPTSLHVYAKHYDRLDKIIDKFEEPGFEDQINTLQLGEVDETNIYRFEQGMTLKEVDQIINAIWILCDNDHKIHENENVLDQLEAGLRGASEKYPNFVGTMAVPMLHKPKSDYVADLGRLLMSPARFAPALQENLKLKGYVE